MTFLDATRAPVGLASTRPMIRRFLRHLLILVSVLGILPGSELLVEHVSELVRHGHPAHSVPGEADPRAAEHGCSPIQHACPCHHSQASSTQAKAQAGAFPTDHWLTWMLDAERVGRRPASARGPSGNDIAPANRSTAPPTPPANA